jgi:hypothetical protein
MVLSTIVIAAAAAVSAAAAAACCYCELLHKLGDEVSGPGGVSQASFVAGSLQELSIHLCRGNFFMYHASVATVGNGCLLDVSFMFLCSITIISKIIVAHASRWVELVPYVMPWLAWDPHTTRHPSMPPSVWHSQCAEQKAAKAATERAMSSWVHRVKCNKLPMTA